MKNLWQFQPQNPVFLYLGNDTPQYNFEADLEGSFEDKVNKLRENTGKDLADLADEIRVDNLKVNTESSNLNVYTASGKEQFKKGTELQYTGKLEERDGRVFAEVKGESVDGETIEGFTAANYTAGEVIHTPDAIEEPVETISIVNENGAIELQPGTQPEYTGKLSIQNRNDQFIVVAHVNRIDKDGNPVEGTVDASTLEGVLPAGQEWIIPDVINKNIPTAIDALYAQKLEQGNVAIDGRIEELIADVPETEKPTAREQLRAIAYEVYQSGAAYNKIPMQMDGQQAAVDALSQPTFFENRESASELITDLEEIAQAKSSDFFSLYIAAGKPMTDALDALENPPTPTIEGPTLVVN